MLFNSYSFVFIFLPVALVGYDVAARFSQRWVVLWLGAVSLAFYGWRAPWLLAILLGSVGLNYGAAALIGAGAGGGLRRGFGPRFWLTAAIVVNLTVLGYYKYFAATARFLGGVFGLSGEWQAVALPLGISFFTFTQIAYLVDLERGQARRHDLPSYLLFVTFFPHLIAGPILHHREMMPQFQRAARRLNLADFTVGATWFVLGLGKKVLLADTFAGTAFGVFGAQGRLSAGIAWEGALAYALELYFDFSGYSDMALGLARMFSIDFPLNFNSPYKSASAIEGWQRWHMTLGRYIFYYIYNPVTRLVRRYRLRQGKGVTRRERANAATFVLVVAMPMMFTMFVAGIWHGAGAQFMVFGLLHGVFLSINNGWRQLRRGRLSFPRLTGETWGSRIIGRVGHVGSVGVTFLGALVSLVFFRSESVGQAVSVLAGMVGMHGAGAAGTVSALATISMRRAAVEIAAGMSIVWFLPNTQQILARFRPSLQKTAWEDGGSTDGALRWMPTAGWAVGVGVVLFVVLVQLEAPSTFLYFQF
jgi:D-alanyl-lipoteichoic acid acyltransferase DltB (MBOAT superfamily)